MKKLFSDFSEAHQQSIQAEQSQPQVFQKKPFKLSLNLIKKQQFFDQFSENQRKVSSATLSTQFDSNEDFEQFSDSCNFNEESKQNVKKSEENIRPSQHQLDFDFKKITKKFSLDLQSITSTSQNSQKVENKVKFDEFKEKYAVQKTLGRGRFGSVYLVKSKQIDEKMYAAKEIQYDNNEESIMKEFNITSSLENPYIIQVKELLLNSSNNIATIIYEYFEGESLYSLIKRKEIQQQTALIIMKQLLTALAYLHEKSIIHRDISLDNILFSEKTQQIKLIDFGLSKVLKNNEESYFSPTSNEMYRAPELVNYMPVTEKIDIYASGLVFLSLILQKPIYAKKSFKKILQEIKNVNIYYAVKLMLLKDPIKRISAKNALNFECF